MTDKVELESTSKEKVAYDLMIYIAGQEGKYPKGDEARAYYLALYHDCWRITHGRAP